MTMLAVFMWQERGDMKLEEENELSDVIYPANGLFVTVDKLRRIVEEFPRGNVMRRNDILEKFENGNVKEVCDEILEGKSERRAIENIINLLVSSTNKLITFENEDKEEFVIREVCGCCRCMTMKYNIPLVIMKKVSIEEVADLVPGSYELFRERYGNMDGEEEREKLRRCVRNCLVEYFEAEEKNFVLFYCRSHLRICSECFETMAVTKKDNIENGQYCYVEREKRLIEFSISDIAEILEDYGMDVYEDEERKQKGECEMGM